MTEQKLPLAGRRVLIVEDEPVIAMMLEDMLAEAGAEVSAHASTLPRALAALTEATFDLAVLDINLHGQRSLPVASALAARGVPFIVATGYGEMDAYGAPCIAKPYQRSQLTDALLRAIAQRA